MKVKVLREVHHPARGCGPLLPGVYQCDKVLAPCPRDPRKFYIRVGVFDLTSDMYEVVAEPHPFSPEGWQRILDQLPKWERDPNRKACLGVAIDPLKTPEVVA